MKLTRNLLQNRNITQNDIHIIENETKFYKKNKRSFCKIEKAVSKITGIRAEVMHMKTRKREIVESRQLVSYYAKIYELGSWRIIGNYFNQDHATAIHSYNTMVDLNISNKKIRRWINEIDKLL